MPPAPGQLAGPSWSGDPLRADMRVLVTGSSGWLGQTLVPRLKRAGCSGKAAKRLGFVCRTGFAEKLAELEASLGLRARAG